VIKRIVKYVEAVVAYFKVSRLPEVENGRIFTSTHVFMAWGLAQENY
jgi:hypothetical protein